MVPLGFPRGVGLRFGVGSADKRPYLDEDTEITDSRLERVDLQLLAMIEDTRSRLNGGTYTVTE